jgi:hypothetical protein
MHTKQSVIFELVLLAPSILLGQVHLLAGVGFFLAINLAIVLFKKKQPEQIKQWLAFTLNLISLLVLVAGGSYLLFRGTLTSEETASHNSDLLFSIYVPVVVYTAINLAFLIKKPKSVHA